MEVAKEKYNAIDITKFIMAIIVIFIHTWSRFGGILMQTKLIPIVTNIAVPFFFITSGFLLKNKIKKQKESKEKVVKKYILNALRIYIIWTIIYLPIIILGWKLDGLTNKEGVFELAKNTIFIGENFNNSYDYLFYVYI